MQSTSPQPYPEFYANIWKNTRPNRAANPTFGIEILKAAFEDDFVGDGEEFAVVDLGAGFRVASKVEAPVPGGPVVEELLAIFEEPIAVVEDALATMGGANNRCWGPISSCRIYSIRKLSKISLAPSVCTNCRPAERFGKRYGFVGSCPCSSNLTHRSAYCV